jgi:hypothetical protein
MPGPIIHVGVALLALLLFFDERYRKYAFFLLPLIVLPDLDHFVPDAPRIVFHNVFMLALPLAIAFYGLRTRNTLLYSVALIASFYVFSHLLLDFFDGGEALFYPLTTTWYGVADAHVWAHSSVVVIPKSLRALVPSEVLGIALTFLTIPAILFVKRQLQLDKEVRESAEQT